MGKVVGNVVRGIGKAVGGLFGGGNVPQAPALPPAPPVTPVRPVDATASADALKKLRDPKRVSRRKTIQTSARGVTQEAPLEYSSLMARSSDTTSSR